MSSIDASLMAAARQHQRRRHQEAAVRVVSGLAVGVVGAVVFAPWSASGAVVVALGSLGAAGALAVSRFRRDARTTDAIARLLDHAGDTAELIRTAWFIETGRSRGSEALGDAIRAEAAAVLPGLLPTADVPFRLPRTVLIAVVAVVLLWLVPPPAPVPPRPLAEADAPLDLPGEPSSPEALVAAPPPEPSATGQTPSASASAESAVASGLDRRAGGGAESASGSGIQGGAGDRAADGDAPTTDAEGSTADGTGSSEGTAREAGTSGASGEAPPSAASKPGRGDAPDVAQAGDAPIAEEDGNTTGQVEQTKAVQDAVQSDADTMHLQGGTPDDRDAQTRDVAGTLDLASDGPQFFDATETADEELDGKGGAGGWTIGLSQPGEGGVNDASGSTWRTEAGIADPPDWTDAPSAWVDAAWQDSPAGVIRRVNDGQVGGSGNTTYAAAWHRYAAVAESDSTRPDVPPGRHALVRQYFLAIAPAETP